MSAQIGTVPRFLRVFVEPIDVELDDDEGLQWTALQTAFPGCSGIYYKNRESTCKSSVKFDGKKFRAPGGAWNDREYFATLSQRCHATQAPFGSYENASKQFEKSVNAVQAMLTATMGGRKMKVGSIAQLNSQLPPSPPTEKSISSSQISSESVEKSQTIIERESLLRSSNRSLTPIEQQFVDLAKISTGKDAIIDGHREQIHKLTEQISTTQNLNAANDKCKELELKINAQEKELSLLRELGEQQTSTNRRVAELTIALEKREQDMKELRENLVHKENNWSRREKELEHHHSQLLADNNQKNLEILELKEKLEVADVSRNLMATEMDQLRPLADLIDLDRPGNVKKYSEALAENSILNEKNLKLEKEVEERRRAFEDIQNIQNSISQENNRLVLRNLDLEGRLTHVNEELAKINGEWKEHLEDQQKQFNSQKIVYEEEAEVLRNSLSEVQQMLEVATRDATENARRLSEATQAREEMRRAFESSEFRHQDPLKRQIRTLSEDLQESQERVAELSNLVRSLTSDAHNSRRDIDDLI